VVTGVILAGGKSSRMGKDKALLPFGEYPTLVEYQFSRLKDIFPKVVISWKEKKVDIESAEYVYDTKDIFAPIIAIETLLTELNSDIFVIGVDIPFFDNEAILKMLRNYKEADSHSVYFAKSPHGVEPLIGIYTNRALPAIRKQIANGEFRLNLLPDIGFVEFRDENLFLNMNYLDDYKRGLNGLPKNSW
jgi:molybdopterin-guanine dinucleotide biosynthesis protein A